MIKKASWKRIEHSQMPIIEHLLNIYIVNIFKNVDYISSTCIKSQTPCDQKLFLNNDTLFTNIIV